MNIQSRVPTTPDEFLLWNEGREGKREFVRGRVVEMMINTTKRHAVLAARLVALLLRSFPYPEFSVGSADVAVSTADGIRYPDVFVDRETPESSGTDLVAKSPVLLVEILSSSSYGRDFVDKAADYTALPSLLHYLVLSQEEPRAWLWSRDKGAGWRGPVEIAGKDQVIELARLNATLPLAELYLGIGTQ